MALPVSLGGWAGVQGRALVAGQRLGKAASRTVQLPVSCQTLGRTLAPWAQRSFSRTGR